MNQKISKISLSEFLWSIQIEDEEQSRLSELLRDSESLPYEIFQNFALKSKKFQDVSKQFQKHIKGFTPGRKSYYPEAQKHILKELSENHALTFGWNAYRYTLLEWISEELPSLNDLLNQAFVNKSLKPTSENFIKSLLDEVTDFDIKPSNIEQLYDVWPMDRIDNFDGLLKECKAFELPRLNRKGLKSIDHRISELETVINSLKSELKKNKLEKQSIEKSVDDKGKSYKAKFDIRLKKIQQELLDEITKQEITSDKRETERQELFNETINEIKSCFNKDCTQKSQTCSSSIEKQIQDERKEQNQQIETLTNRISTLESSLTKTLNRMGEHFKREQNGIQELVDTNFLELDRKILSYSHVSKNSTFLDKYFRSPKASEVLRIISENDFLDVFLNYLGHFNLKMKKHEALAWHIFLKENPILVINDRRIFDAWIYALGWSQFPIQFAASPRWSSPEDWQEDVLSLLQINFTSPILIEIHNFDVGLVEGYLLPIIALWNESGFNGGIGNKLILHPSNKITNHDIMLVCEYGKCLGISSYKSEIDQNLSYNISQFKVQSLKEETPVSTETLIEWDPNFKAIDEPLLKRFTNDCQSLFNEKKLSPPAHIFNRIPQIISKYGETFENQEKLYSSFLNIFVSPWLNVVETINESDLPWDSHE